MPPPIQNRFSSQEKTNNLYDQIPIYILKASPQVPPNRWSATITLKTIRSGHEGRIEYLIWKLKLTIDRPRSVCICDTTAHR